MDFATSTKAQELLKRLHAFMDEHVYPAEAIYDEQLAGFGVNRWQVLPIVEELKVKARAAGLWNLFLPESSAGAGLSNLDYAPLCEVMGQIPWAPEVFNCSAPDTGNMELLERYATEAQKERWLRPLLDGSIRSAFLMTEPDVASSDATNVQTSIRREGDVYVINGRKWWSSGVGDPRCEIYILMGKTDPTAATHQQQSQILIPANTPGIRIVRMLSVFGYDDAPHGHAEMVFENVKVPVDHMILGEGRGFEIAQGRLGPGRIHHCMRTIGIAERALALLCQRISSRTAFGKRIVEHSVWEERIADARIEIECARLLTLKAAWMMDTAGNKSARALIAMIKVKAPLMALKILDEAMQGFGAAGLSAEPRLAALYAHVRTLRFADGPDDVHRRTIAHLELKQQNLK
jgi:alkylation response protein AidB-like acyl-CoA dehydrogenase